MTDRTRHALLVAAVVGLPLAAAWTGARAPLRVGLNLGPGDAPYLSGFAPGYEIDDRVATRWTSYDAAVRLPLAIRGSASVSYRLARVFPQTAQVEIRVDGRTVDRFECRGGQFLERTAPFPSTAAPLAIEIHSDSHERLDRGVKLDWIRVDVANGRVRLTGAARVWPALVIALIFALLRGAGWRADRAAWLALPAAVAAAGGLLLDPWLVHRLLRGLPLALVAFGGPALLFGRRLVRSARCSPEALRLLTVLGLVAFTLRALAVNIPDFYYPDLRTHARLVDVVRRAGLDFLVRPSHYIWEHGVWRTQAHGRTYAFPYAPSFHIPFALLDFEYDDLVTALKLGAAAVSVVPLIVVWALARRLAAPTWGAALMLAIPSYTSRLSFAFLPALFGHAVDMCFLYWLAGRLDRIRERRVFAAAALLLSACQLAYVSGTTQTTLLVVVLALCLLATGRRDGARNGLRLLGVALVASAISIGVYYRDFVPMAVDLASQALSGAAGAASRYPIQGWLAVVQQRTHAFFDGVYPVLAAFGIASLLRRGGPARVLTAAWLATYLLLLLGRAKLPDVFLHGHETLLVTPLVCLAAGVALARLWGLGPWGRAVAALLLAALTLQGLHGQWAAIAGQLGNAG